MLHNHSTFSFYAGVCTVTELVARAKVLGYPALALTDTDRMSGLILFYRACQKAGIKPILGVELTEPRSPDAHIVLLARNASGYGDLCEIITRRHLESSTFTFAETFSRPWPDLFFITGFPHLLELLASTPNCGRLYAELVNNSDLTRQRSRAVVTCAQRLGVSLVATNDSYFLDPMDWEIHRILKAIGVNSTLSRLKPSEYASQFAFLRTPEDMERLFPHHQDAVRNAYLIADQCNTELSLNKWIMPCIDAPSGHTPMSYLSELAYQGLERNYGSTPSYTKARTIQEMELRVIDQLGYPSYFLIVKDIRDWANGRFAGGYRKPRDCTILRGSAANSITFYNIGVTDVDPIRYDLYFQRFLNDDRASPPDADLDFGWDEREEALEYMAQRWGRDRVAITCTTNHFRYRAAFRETAKVFGYSDEQISALMREHGLISSFEDNRVSSEMPGHEIRIAGDRDSELSRIRSFANRIFGKPRFLGQHPGGVLVTNDPIYRHVACEYSGREQNRVITQIDMHNGIEDLGLIKFDLLGNGSLSVLRDTLAQIAEQGLPDPHVEDLEKCYTDPMTKAIIRDGRTRGVFYIESPAQSRLNKKSQADTFEEVTITSSLIRPAGARYAKTFVQRHRRAKAGLPPDWKFLHPSLEPILKDSHDVCAFQEDITKICHHVAGLTYKKADKIRKMMNSLHEGVLDEQEYQATAREFIGGCMTRRGLTRHQALELWERVNSFTGFSFCKSHSASYAQLSFKCSYLKAHYPAQFFASVISNNHGFYTPPVYLDEARRLGVRILPMNINESRASYYGSGQWIRPGLMHIRNFRRANIERIIASRVQNGPFRDIVDFVRRVPLHRADVERLILTGAFDGLGHTQPQALYILDGIYGKGNDDAPSLFDLAAFDRSAPSMLHDYSFAQRCLNELEHLGYMLSGNLLAILSLHPAAKGATPAKSIPHYVGKRVKVFGTIITRRAHLIETRREEMMFVTLQDATDTVDVVLWPDVNETFGRTLDEPGPFEVWGRVAKDWDTCNIIAERIRSVVWSPNMIDFERASQLLAQQPAAPSNIPLVKAA